MRAGGGRLSAYEEKFRCNSFAIAGRDELEAGDKSARLRTVVRATGCPGRCLTRHHRFLPPPPIRSPASAVRAQHAECVRGDAARSPRGIAPAYLTRTLFPTSAPAATARLHVQWPMQFQLRAASGRTTHVGVLEFTSPEGRAYLPHWVMTNLGLQESDMVTLRDVRLPKATFVKLRPHSKEFLLISNPRAVYVCRQCWRIVRPPRAPFRGQAGDDAARLLVPDRGRDVPVHVRGAATRRRRPGVEASGASGVATHCARGLVSGRPRAVTRRSRLPPPHNAAVRGQHHGDGLGDGLRAAAGLR